MKSITKILLFVLAIVFVVSVNAQQRNQRQLAQSTNQKTRILFILDCSYSMYGKWQSDTKIKITQSILSNVIDTLKNKPNLQLALRAFGHTNNYNQQDCNDTKLEIPFSNGNSELLKDKLKSLVPKGSSPISNSLKASKADFPECKNCRNIIILITDGLDDCSDDCCEVSKALQKEGSIIKPFIIGIGKGYGDQFKCAGNYFEANNEIEFSKILNDIVNQALYSTTCQVNLLDNSKTPTETNVPMIFYETKSKAPRYSFIHTFNEKGLSDTLEIDPLISYDIEIQTIPKTRIENISLKAGSHTTISANTPQGTMVLKYKGKEQSNAKPIGVLVKKNGEKKSINIQNINSTEKYLIGKYDLEVLTQPRLNLNDVEIAQSSTTTIEIPSTGSVQITKPMDNLSTLLIKEDNNWEFVANLSDSRNETLTLLPGDYQIISRSKASTQTKQTKIKEFRVESGEITVILIENK
ncbi:MAG: VWA domain-containing protein [Bacteroidales bacterium]